MKSYTKIIQRPKHNVVLATYRTNNEDRAFLVPCYDCDFLLMKVVTNEDEDEPFNRIEMEDNTIYHPTKFTYDSLYKLDGDLVYRLVSKDIVIWDLPLILMGEVEASKLFGGNMKGADPSETLRKCLISVYEKLLDYGMEISLTERRIFLHGSKEYLDGFYLRSLDSWYERVTASIPRI